MQFNQTFGQRETETGAFALLVCAFRTCPNGCMTRGRSSALIPVPVSSTRISSWASSVRAALTVTIPPWSVNFRAQEVEENLPQPDLPGTKWRQVRGHPISGTATGLDGIQAARAGTGASRHVAPL